MRHAETNLCSVALITGKFLELLESLGVREFAVHSGQGDRKCLKRGERVLQEQ